MVESLVSIALEKLADVAGQQLALFAGATREMVKLSSTFQSIQAVLTDAENRQAGDKYVHLWLSRLRHIAYDIQDLLAEGQMSGLGGEEGNGDDGGSRNQVCACLLSPYNQAVSRYKVALRIKEIREMLDEIADEKNKYSFSSSSSSLSWDQIHRTGVRSQRLTTSLVDGSEKMIGRENDKEIMVSRLVSGNSHEEKDVGQVHVVAIVGMGGLGKTTLAQQIYHDSRVRDNFNKFIWVCVSDVFNVIRLTKAILEQLKKESTSLLELESLQNELLQELRGKRFLLVLDDVWNDDEEKWKTLRLPLNSGAQRSRILVTTRSKKVANTTNAVYIHELKGLSDDHSWTLFSSRAFAGRKAEEYLELETIGRAIVNQCTGVPLSIKAIGTAMHSKRTREDWENVMNSKTWSLPQVTDKILPALLLTYSNLPAHLKQCFVYCSIFPKDRQLEKHMLVRLWVAQGFIKSEGNREIEDIGAEYFDDLVAWSMFQKVNKYGTICTIHDLLHDLVEFIASDEIYSFISTGKGGKLEQRPGSSNNVRHAFLSPTGTGDTSNSMPITLHGAKKLRTLFLKGVDDESHKVMVVGLFQQARFLRSVTLENSKIKMLPNGIGKMKHLRHLDLSGSHVVELPESVSHLLNLHTLILKNCGQLKKLPRGIGRMVSLRHVEIEGTDKLEYLPRGLGKISGLRSLSKLIVGGGGEGVEGCRIDELQILNSLHGSLQIEHLERVSSREEAEKAQLMNKSYLRRLALSMSDGRDDNAEAERMDNVFEGLRPHVNLEELELNSYRGSRFPSWMDVMPCLRKLDHFCSKMERVPHLPSLKELKIGSLRNEILPDGGWERLVALQKLQISFCSYLKCLPEGLTQLHSLQELEISWCHRLESLPEGLGQLKKLHSLRITDHLKALRCLPDSLGQLELLENLQIGFCEKLESLPDSLVELKALNRLGISSCESLVSLPNSLGELKALSHLEISCCQSLGSLPDSLGQLESLQHLGIEACGELESLPHSFGQLKALNHLKIIVCHALRSLPDGLQHLPLFRELEIHNCPRLSERCRKDGGEDWPKISHISNITIVDW